VQPARPPYPYIDYAGADPAVDPDSGGLLEYWRIIRRRKGTVVLITFLCALAAVLYTLPQTPVYQARTTIEIQGVNENFLNMRDMNPTSSTTTYYPEIDIQTQVRILQSGDLLKRVVDRIQLTSRPLFASPTRVDAWRKSLGLAPAPPVDLHARAIAMAAGALKVRAQPNTRLVEILCDSTDPDLAADFANSLTGEYIEQNLNARWQTAQHTGEWLTRQMEDVRIKLEKSEDALQAYARETGLLFTAEKDNVADQKLKQLQDELSKAQADRVARQSRYELATRASADSIAEVLDDANLKDIQGKLTDLRRQLAELSSSYTPAHPKVKKVEAQIATLEATLERTRTNILNRIRNDFESAQRRERLLSADYAAQARLMSSQADQVSHYNILKREVDTNRQLYDNILQKVKEAGVASALRASNVRVVDAAAPPKAPYKPNLYQNTALGLCSGLFLGIVFVVFRERADRTIQEPGDINLYLGLQELGLIPSASSDPMRRIAEKQSKSKALSLSNSAQSVELAVWQRKPSALAESFRAAITSIMFSGENGHRPRVIVLSSAAPEEGKTTVISNLAIALAEIRQRVLLIDGDMRRPRLHQVFHVDNDSGMVDILRRSEPFDTSLNGLARTTEIPNLWVLPSGKAELGDTALLHSARLRELIQQVRKDYDTILIDTPPMLTMADARVIGRVADAVILVVRANETTRDALKTACQKFSEDGTRVLGTMLNGWNPAQPSKYGYGSYYQSYKSYKNRVRGRRVQLKLKGCRFSRLAI
jgi:capsular exopolysaccharide synthesis family protein